MKKISIFLLLMALFMPWAANTQKALPYSYGFEDNNLATDGWILSGSTSSSTKIYSENDAPEGSYLFKFHYSERNAYLISPLLSGTGNGVEVSFQYMRNTSSSSYQEQFQVGYTTDENVTDPTEFTYGGTVYSGTSWLTYENSFPANTKRIAIKYIYIDGMYLRLDDFHFNLPASCPKPIDLVCTAYTATTATLSWTENGTATNWVIEYADNANFTGAQTANASGTPSKQLTGLTAEQTYYARVKADCGGGDQSGWSNTCEFMPSAYTYIGTGTSTSGYVPLYGNYNNSYDQMIYTASQLGLEASEITNIGFNSSAANSNPRTISIYMGHTTKSSFSSNSDFVSINDLTEVYSGTWNITAGWNEFELTTPFDYDGSSNLVIALYSKGSYKSTTFYYTATSSNQVVYAYSDSNDPNPSTNEGNWSSFNSRGTTTYLPNLKLLAVASATPKPRNLVVSDITSESATVTWAAPADNVTGYQYQYKYATTPTWPETWNSLAANVTHKDLVALAANTLYDFRVRANYAEGDSDPAEIQFTTEATCMPVTNITVSDITSTGAKLAWTPGGSETSWQYLTLAHGDTPDWTSERVITSNTHTNVPANIYAYTGVQPQPNTEYDFYVRANCGGGDYSEAAMLTFRTACGAITSFPINYGFETSEGFPSNASTPTTNQLGTCWRNEATVQNGTNADRVWGTSTTYKHTGSQALVLPDKGNSTNFAKTMLVFPEMEFTNPDGYSVSFWIYRSGSSSNPEGFKLYVSDCDTIGPNAVELGHYSRNYSIAYPDIVTSGWYQYETAPITRTGSVYLIFEGQSYYGSATYVDDITIKEYVAVTADQIVETVSDPATEMTWNEFAQHVNNGDHFTSTTFTLMDNITVSTMVGTSTNPFTGTFDGNSHTITVNLTATDANFTAPFRVIKNATIQNLKVNGTINDGGFKFCAGFAGDCYGNNIFTNCESAVTINATIEGDGTHGGFIARNYGGGGTGNNLCTTVFNGCAFTGQLLGANTTQVGGFCGWSEYQSPNYAKTMFNNCLFAPQAVTMSTTNSAAFARRRNASYVNFNNCYFMQDFNDGTNNTAQGKQAYTITGVDPVYVAFSGEHTLYNMSGIDAYTVGMIHGYTKLAGEGDVVTLTLDGAPGYEADHGTLVANGDTYTLTMEAFNTQITGIDCPVPYNVAVPAANLTARSAQVTWTGNSDSYTIMYGEVVDVVTTYDFEDQTIPANFTNDATYPWVIASSGHGGSYSIKSGNGQGGHNSTTSEVIYELTLASESTLSFWAKISSESSYDKGYFSIDGSNKINGISGAGSWIEYSYPLAAGTHTLRWYYTKDTSTDSNDDCFYVDDITITSSAVDTWTTLSNIAASPYTIENLTPETSYQVKVSGTCAGVPTDYSDVVEFNTLATCPAPTELAVTDGSVTAHAATITWTENGEATTWIVEYADNADFTGALTETVEDNATYSFDELDGETTYYVRVKAHCGEEDESDYSNVVNFTTLVACQAPTVLTVTATTTTTATLSWTENGTATAWQICLNGDETNLIAANSNPFTLESLTAATTYTVKVRANCGGIDGESDWSNTVSFTTDCDAITTFPWMVDFESFTNETVPNCWDNSASTTSTLSGNPERVWGVYTYGENKMIRMYNYFVNDGTALINTPDLVLPANAECNLTFDYSHTASCGDFIVKVSEDGGTTFTNLATYSKGSGTSNYNPGEFTPATISLAAYAGKTITLQFFATADYGSGAIFVDNVMITPVFTKTIEAVGDEDWVNGKGGYYFIASPVAEAVTPAADNGFIVGDYDLYYFSQTGDGEGNEWINFKDETLGGFDIVNGTGYLYASKEGTTLTFTGAPYSGDGQVTLTKTANTDGFDGYNLVGNPFNMDAYIEKPFYTLENSDTYTENTAGTAIHAMQGLLVVADNDGDILTFSTEAPAGKSAKLNMNVTKGRAVVDHAIISFNEGQQLPKIQFRNGSTKVYIPQDGKDYAIVSADSNVGEMPVSFKAESNGTYTLSFTNEEVTFNYLHLIDNMTGTETDLLANPSYTFDARTTDYASRFRLVFATGNNSDDDSFAFFSNGSFVINNEGNATLQVIDVTGRILKSESINGSASINFNAAAGVYMLRLVNGENVKVQKVVVK